ncbi:tryptophan 2,3-dioxygenase, partial [Klebsiella pneumoniae]|nr:tryptophan 2,3-dioxygenase [Klebsiella pneumoniae]
MLKVFESDPSAHRLLETLLGEPTLYDEFWRYLSRQGYDVPASALERDVSAPYVRNDELIPLVKAIYE